MKNIVALCLAIVALCCHLELKANGAMQGADSVSLSVVDVNPIVISSGNRSSQRVMSSERMIKSIPSIMGECDIVKYITTLAGVNSTSILDPNFYVRGGDGYQNRFLVGGFPVASPRHLSGVMSLFDPYILHSSILHKSGYPAQYSGALSSYLNMFPALRRDTVVHGEATLGMIASSLKSTIPLGEKGGELSVALRYSYIKELFAVANILNPQVECLPYTFYDTSLNYHNQIGGRWSINLFGLYSSDDIVLDSSNSLNFKWGSYSANVVARRSGLLSTLTLASGVWGENSSGEYDNVVENSIAATKNNLRVHAIYDYRLGDKWVASAGSSVENSLYGYGCGDEAIDAFTSNLWGGARYESERFLADVGLNFELYSGRSRSTQLLPRAHAIYNISDEVSLKGDYARTAQYDFSVTLLSLPTPADIALPLDEGGAPTTCDQVSVGVNYSVSKALNFSGALFYRYFNNMKEVATTSLSQNAQQASGFKQLYGSAQARGCEVEATINRDRWMLRANYTFTDSQHTFAQINGGRPFNTPYDIKHSVTVSGAFEISSHWSVNTLWQYSSGRYVTFPVGVSVSQDAVTGGAVVLPIYADRYNFQLPATHRLDVSAEYGAGNWSLNVGLYNAYNQPNISFVKYEIRQYDNYKSYISPQGKSILPLIPYLSASYKW